MAEMPRSAVDAVIRREAAVQVSGASRCRPRFAAAAVTDLRGAASFDRRRRSFDEQAVLGEHRWVSPAPDPASPGRLDESVNEASPRLVTPWMSRVGIGAAIMPRRHDRSSRARSEGRCPVARQDDELDAQVRFRAE